MFKVPDPIEVTFIFSKYVGLDPASTLYPQKYQEYQAHPKNIFQICTLTIKKRQIDRNDSTKHKKNHNFHHTPKHIYLSDLPDPSPLQKMQFKILNLQKWTEPTYI